MHDELYFCPACYLSWSFNFYLASLREHQRRYFWWNTSRLLLSDSRTHEDAPRAGTIGIITTPWHVGPTRMRRLTTASEGRKPISLLLSWSGLEYVGNCINFIDEARDDCRLCRILKDFLDHTETQAQTRRQRMQNASESEETHVHGRVRLMLRLIRTRFTISNPDVIFSEIRRFRPTTNIGIFTLHDLSIPYR